jgi:riboflavin kinase/FMN adenylyltransferase
MAQHYTSRDGVKLRHTWLTIGSFDGVHIGHQQLVKELNIQAHQVNAKTVVLTFHPHPAVILRGRTGALYLTTPCEKAELLGELGTDIVVTHPFTYQLSQSTAHEYVAYLVDHLGFSQLWVGYDFALGKGREGNVTVLTELGQEFGYQVHIVEPVISNGQTVSSSQIRKLLKEGNITEANKLLGRRYQVVGEVIHGDGRGKQIGVPTANLDTGVEKLIPSAGVYACKARIEDTIWAAAVNIGTRPTFTNTDQQSHVEAHLLDYSDDLYNQKLALEFVARLRGEQRFINVEDLIHQIREDIHQTREIITSIDET